jgi:hypothetical protein
MKLRRIGIVTAGILSAMVFPIVIVGFTDNESVELRLFWAAVVKGWWDYQCIVVSFGDSASMLVDRINRVATPVCTTNGVVSFDADMVSPALTIDVLATTISVLMAMGVVVEFQRWLPGRQLLVYIDLVSVVLSILLLGYCLSLADKLGHAGTDSLSSTISFGSVGFVGSTMVLFILDTVGGSSKSRVE